jgi:glucokinase
LASFLFVTVGTGISSCLVIDGEPYVGARGLTGTFASAAGLIPALNSQLSTLNIAEGPPLEQFASGPALALRYRQVHPQSRAEAPEVLSLADSGDRVAGDIVKSAGCALGAAVAQLVNTLDPEAVVLGGGLGLAQGAFRKAVEDGFRSHLWSHLHADLPLCSAKLGTDAALIGAALASSKVNQS